jgi:hypothetical protein
MTNIIGFEKSICDPNNSSIYAQGLYVSENTNKLTKINKLENKIFLERYIGQNDNYLNLNDACDIPLNTLQLVNTFTISMWIFPLIDDVRLYPMSIFSKGNINTIGETNLQITVDNKLCYNYQYSNKICTIKTKAKILSKTFTFITISKTSDAISIYINDKIDTFFQITNAPSFTSNPIIIGSGMNTIDYNGIIENFTVSEQAVSNFQSHLSIYYKNPSSYVFKIDKGNITYSNYKLTNSSSAKIIEQSKNIVILLSQYLNGFIYNVSINTPIFYINLSNNLTLNLNGPNIENYKKITMLNIGIDQIFAKQYTTYPQNVNVVIEDPVEAEGFLCSNNGIRVMFNKGSIIAYNKELGKYEYDNIEEIDAMNILNEFTQLIGYIHSDRYIFYVSYTAITPNEEFTNRFRMKMLSYNLGTINSDINFIGSQTMGSFKTVSNTTILQTISDNNIPMNDNCKKIEVIDRLAQTNNNDLINTNNSFLFIYDTKQINITGTLNKCYDTYINTLPKLENKYNIDFEFDSTVDLVDILLTRQVDIGRQVIYNYNKPVCPAIYNFSIVTNSYVNVKINGRDYVINSQTPMHILFHNFKNILELEVSFYYEKVSQIVRFMMAEPN